VLRALAISVLVGCNSTPPPPPAPVKALGFEALAAIPTMTQQARAQWPDSQLEAIDVNGVRADGTVDLTDAQTGVTYTFWSASHAVGVDPVCRMMVLAHADGSVQIMAVEPRDDCKPPLMQPMACSLSQIWADAIARGEKHRELPAHVRLSGQSGKPNRISFEGKSIHGLNFVRDDDCFAPKPGAVR
jgi:hypothetical protein